MIDLNPSRFDMTTASPHRDWFEFILDFSLLDRHLLTDQPDPSGCQLIIQFLYHANMTEQMYNSGPQIPPQQPPPQQPKLESGGSEFPVVTTPPASPAVAAGGAAVSGSSGVATTPAATNAQTELKTKRIKVLRILAIKTAAILDWNLIKFESEIPIAVMSDLLHIFLRLTMSELEVKPHSLLELDKLEKPALFSLQLLHRWCLRVVIFSRFPKKPPTKSIQVNLPGSLNPLQHMRDANENILKMIVNNVHESVDFLEKFVKTCSVENLTKPTSECFQNQAATSSQGQGSQEQQQAPANTTTSTTSGVFTFEWDKAELIPLNDIKNMIIYDLGVYWFQMDDYTKANEYLTSFKEYKLQLTKNDEARLKEVENYSIDLDNYLLACQSMLSTEKVDVYELPPPPPPTLAKPDHFTRQLLTKKLAIEKSCSTSEFKDLFEHLLDDNKTTSLSVSFRTRLESIVASSVAAANTSTATNSATASTSSQQTLDQLFSCNLVRLVADCSYVSHETYKLDNLKSLSQVVSRAVESMPPHYRFNLISYIYLNMRKLSSQCRGELLKNKHFALSPSSMASPGGLQANKRVESGPSGDDANAMDFNTPSSPPQSSLNTTKTTDSLAFAKLALQTCDPMMLKNSINKFNACLTGSQPSLRHFWPKWLSQASRLVYWNNESNNLIINATYLKLANVNDMDYFFITYAKIYHLVQMKKFNCAFKLYNAYENVFRSNDKVSRLINNQFIYLNIQNYLNCAHWFAESDVSRAASQPSNRFISRENLVKASRNFLTSHKNEPEIPIEILTSVLAFLLTTSEYQTILSNECNLTTFILQKKNIIHSLNPVFCLFNISRQIAKLCLEIPKSDKNSLRKTARELWDSIVELFTDSALNAPKRIEQAPQQQLQQQQQQQSGPSYDPSNISSFLATGSSTNQNNQTQSSSSSSSSVSSALKDNQILFVIRSLFRKMLLMIKDVEIKNLLISLLSTVFNIADSQANNEIFNEYRHLWPSSLANANTLNLNSLSDVLAHVLSNDALVHVNPFHSGWLRTAADISLAKSLNSDAIKHFLSIFITESRYFLRARALNFKNFKKEQQHADVMIVSGGGHDPYDQNQAVKFLDEKMIRYMIKSMVALNKFTQAALLCQLLTNNNDYSNAFRYLQESSIIVPSQDDMDGLYAGVWDMAMLEYLAHLNASRGFLAKKNACLKIITALCTSPNNPSEIYLKTVEFKKAALFLNLVKYYF